LKHTKAIVMSLNLEHVSARYKGADRNAVNDINLKVEEGDVVGILGITGSGKTTLLRVLNGLFPKYFKGKLSGNVIVDGLQVQDHDLPVMTQHVGLVLPDPALQIVSLTVADDIAFGPSNLGLSVEEIEKRVSRALEMTRLKGFENRTPSTLSGGEQQSLAIASVLAMMPKIIAMDEPISMLDPMGKERVLSVIKELNERFGITILLTEAGGDIEYVIPYLNKMVLMKRGEIIAAGTPRELIDKKEFFEEAGIRPPQVTELLWRLGVKNIEDMAFSVDETQRYIIGKLRKKIELIGETRIEREETPKEPVIRIKNLHHMYPGGVHALRGINLDIYDGEMAALIGQNGSGKTTLANHLIGVLKPTNPDAQVMVNGINVTKEPTDVVIKHINYVFQNPDNQLFCETVEEEISFGPRALELPEEEVTARVMDMLRLFDIEGSKGASIFWLTKDLKTYVAMASVIVLKPKILIIDEPTTGLDYAAGLRVMKILRELNKRGHTIIFITHNMKLVAEYASRVIVLREGSILTDGHPREVFSKPGMLEKAFIKPPQITQLAQGLTNCGFPPDVLTVDEMYEIVSQNFDEGS